MYGHYTDKYVQYVLRVLQMMYCMLVFMCVLCMRGLQNQLIHLITNCHTCVKMKIAPVEVIIRENILTQIRLNGPMLFNIRMLTNEELEPLKTIGM